MSGNKKKDCKATAVQISEIKIEKNHIRGRAFVCRERQKGKSELATR